MYTNKSVFPEGIDNISIKQAAGIKRIEKKIQFPPGKDKTISFQQDQTQELFNLKALRWMFNDHEIYPVDQVTQREIQNTTQIF